MSGKCEKYMQIGKQKLTNYTRYVKFKSIENVTENEVNSSIKSEDKRIVMSII